MNYCKLERSIINQICEDTFTTHPYKYSVFTPIFTKKINKHRISCHYHIGYDNMVLALRIRIQNEIENTIIDYNTIGSFHPTIIEYFNQRLIPLKDFLQMVIYELL